MPHMWSCWVWQIRRRPRLHVCMCVQSPFHYNYIYFLSLELLTLCRHFEQTQHTFAMRLGTQRVWDYIGGEVEVELFLAVP